MAERYDMGEGVVKLTGNAGEFEKTIAEMDASHAKLQERLAAREAVAAKRSAAGWASASTHASSRIQQWALTNRPISFAGAFESKRERTDDRRTQRLIEAIKTSKGALAGAGRSFQEKVQQAQPAGAVGAAVGGGILGLVSAASPLAINTLTESLSLLAATIGRDFQPMILELSFTIQRAVKWWSELDSGVKENIVSVAKFVAIAGAAALALGAITRVAATLAALGMGPIGWAAVGIGAAGIGNFGGGGEGKEEPNLAQNILGFVKDLGIPMAFNKKQADLVNKVLEVPKKGGELGTFGPSSMGSLQDFYRKMLVESTGGSSLEAKKMQIQAETRDAAVRQAAAGEELVKIVKEKKGGVVP